MVKKKKQSSASVAADTVPEDGSAPSPQQVAPVPAEEGGVGSSDPVSDDEDEDDEEDDDEDEDDEEDEKESFPNEERLPSTSRTVQPPPQYGMQRRGDAPPFSVKKYPDPSRYLNLFESYMAMDWIPQTEWAGSLIRACSDSEERERFLEALRKRRIGWSIRPPKKSSSRSSTKKPQPWRFWRSSFPSKGLPPTRIPKRNFGGSGVRSSPF